MYYCYYLTCMMIGMMMIKGGTVHENICALFEGLWQVHGHQGAAH
jgi:hypothetical protein